MYNHAYYLILLMTLQGLPTAIESEGMSFTTTLPAPMMQRSPMITPGQIVTPPPSQQSSPMVIGEHRSMGLRRSIKDPPFCQ